MSGLLLALALAASPLAPQDEARARALDQEIRCVQCVNEPISQSTSEIAGDMRDLVRERISAGDTDQEIRDFFADRYGADILYRPPLGPATWLLWLSPLVLLLLGAGLALPAFLRRSGAPATEEPEESGER